MFLDIVWYEIRLRNEIDFVYLLSQLYIGCAIIQLPDAMISLFNYIKGKILCYNRFKSHPIPDNNKMHNSSKMDSLPEIEIPQIESNVYVKTRKEKHPNIELEVINLVNEIKLINQRLDQLTTK